jgi:predicted outer membrane protein
MFKRLVRFLPILAIALLTGAVSAGTFAFAGDRDDGGHDKSGEHGQQGKGHDDDGRDHEGRHHDDDGRDHKGRHHEDDGRHHKGRHHDHKGHHHNHKGRHHDRSGHHHGHGFKRCNSRRVSGLDDLWLKMYVQTNLFEIAGGEAALERATTDEVRELATRLVAEHTAALQEALALAQKLRIDVPDEPSPLQQWALRAVATFEGGDFDVWFADLQVEGHRQAIMEAEFEASEGCNRKVRALAAASVPVLQEHLAHAEAVLNGLTD